MTPEGKRLRLNLEEEACPPCLALDNLPHTVMGSPLLEVFKQRLQSLPTLPHKGIP